ncbi:hypothetical protein Pelo_10906 [Pelomyxa schiedti]|nr:hypothetical protein Pelo_10906 [Pelomyxa schiedti]
MVDEAPVEMVAAAPTADEYGDSGVADAQKMMEPCCVSPNPKKQLKAMSVKSWWHIYNVTQVTTFSFVTEGFFSSPHFFEKVDHSGELFCIVGSWTPWKYVQLPNQSSFKICGIVGICFTLYGIYGKLTKEDIQFLANTSISDQPTLCSTVDPSSDLLAIMFDVHCNLIL